MCDEGKEEEAMIRLSRVGFDYTIGYLKGGFESWRRAGKEIETVKRMDAEELAGKYSEKPLSLTSVKKE